MTDKGGRDGTHKLERFVTTQEDVHARVHTGVC